MNSISWIVFHCCQEIVKKFVFYTETVKYFHICLIEIKILLLRVVTAEKICKTFYVNFIFLFNAVVSVCGETYKILNYRFNQQILPQKLSEKSFWVKVQEEKLASPDILTGLAQKFSSKPPSKKMDDVVDRYVRCFCNSLVAILYLPAKEQADL